MVAMNAKPKKIRLDDLLVERGDFPDRATALRAVMAREVRVDDVYATSAAIKVAPTADIFIRGRKQFVSRGGKKLQGALDAFKQDVAGMNCLDIGSSTGGFTDCLLQAGASRVAALDVNYGSSPGRSAKTREWPSSSARTSRTPIPPRSAHPSTSLSSTYPSSAWQHSPPSFPASAARHDLHRPGETSVRIGPRRDRPGRRPR